MQRPLELLFIHNGHIANYSHTAIKVPDDDIHSGDTRPLWRLLGEP